MQLLAKTADIIRFTSGLQVPGIAEVHLIVDESSATKILGNAAVDEVQMVATLPGVKIEGMNIDALHGKNSLLVWVLSKGLGPEGGKIIDSEEYLRLLSLMDAVLEKYREGIRQSQAGKCPFLAGLDFEQMVTTAEYNTFGGWNGWCTSIALK